MPLASLAIRDTTRTASASGLALSIAAAMAMSKSTSPLRQAGARSSGLSKASLRMSRVANISRESVSDESSDTRSLAALSTFGRQISYGRRIERQNFGLRTQKSNAGKFRSSRFWPFQSCPQSRERICPQWPSKSDLPSLHRAVPAQCKNYSQTSARLLRGSFRLSSGPFHHRLTNATRGAQKPCPRISGVRPATRRPSIIPSIFLSSSVAARRASIQSARSVRWTPLAASGSARSYHGEARFATVDLHD